MSTSDEATAQPPSRLTTHQRHARMERVGSQRATSAVYPCCTRCPETPCRQERTVPSDLGPTLTRHRQQTQRNGSPRLQRKALELLRAGTIPKSANLIVVLLYAVVLALHNQTDHVAQLFSEGLAVAILRKIFTLSHSSRMATSGRSDTLAFKMDPLRHPWMFPPDRSGWK